MNGTLMRGLALHDNIASAVFLVEVSTAPCYRVYSIGDVHPGMFRLDKGEQGISVPGELYLVSRPQWDRIEAGEPPNLYRGPVMLNNGREVWGILYPRELAERNGRDISSYGGWRAYMQQRVHA
ncbi:MAG: gamma-glutamylcyclotransferase [Steroidobacter sp.]